MNILQWHYARKLQGHLTTFPSLTFPAAEYHRPLANTNLYCLVTEAHVYEQLAQSRYMNVVRPRVEPATSWT